MPISTSTLPLLRTSLESLLSRTKCTRFIVHWDLSSPHLSPPSVSIHTSPFLLSSRQRRDDAIEDTSLFHRDRSRLPNLLVIQPGIRPDTLLQAKLSEALNLAKSLEEQRDGFYNTEFSEKKLPPHVVVQNPAVRSVSADTYFGKGTVQNVNCHLNALESQKDELDAVFVNAILSGIQQRNLERIWGKPVLDRVALIIEIFNAHAQTKEAKLQAELAALMYKKTRLVRLRGRKGRCTFGEAGLSEVVSARGRSSGGRGFISGAGETELQLQRRRILERRNHLLTEIEEVRRTRAVQRAGRRRHGGTHGEGLATVAIVGYTNAGKSTLVNALSDSDLYSDDRMFATVDPRLRSIILPSGRKVLLSDTVGFISDLPVQLVEAFHATLEEVVEADLLVHVLDSSAPDPEEHRSTVLRVLNQIGVSEEKLNNMIEVWNKVDLQENAIGVNERVDMVCELSSDSEDNGARCISESENSDGAPELSPGEPVVCHDGNNRHNEGLITDLVGCSSVGFRDSETGSRIVGPQVENVRHVKTSAVTGIGLQELLVLVDEKLNGRGEGELGKTVFDRKWRPLQTKSAAVRG